MMMNAGKMVWHKRTRNEGEWVCESALNEERDEQVLYTIYPMHGEGWLPEVHTMEKRGRRTVGSEKQLSVGPVRKLADAKRICDEHHHKAISEFEGVIGVKDYIKRYPL